MPAGRCGLGGKVLLIGSDGGGGEGGLGWVGFWVLYCTLIVLYFSHALVNFVLRCDILVSEKFISSFIIL